MNITLLEMLRQNFGISVPGLDPLPTDESGVNVKLIYSIIRNSIKNQRKWDVEEQAILGIFSFNKFIMWNDIHNNANKLTQNKIVSSLINGKIEWNATTEEITADLKAGDYVYITGTLYVARDAAHKRMMEVLDEGKELPIDIKDCTIYYMGPSPAREGRPIGSAGPTTASRMDKYAPRLLDLGEKAMIGKGKRTKEVIDAVIRNKAVYFAAIGGAGALLSKCIKKSEIVCYEDLGAEAIRKIEVEDFPVIVVIDSEGNNLYETAIKEFAVVD